MRTTIACVAILALSACAGASQNVFVPSSQPAQIREPGGALVVRVTLKSPRFRPSYVSTSARGMSVRVVGLENLKKTVGLSVNASGCRSKMLTRFCELEIPGLKSCPSKKNCYSATISMYDAYDAKTHAIPSGAKLLSNVENVGFKITHGVTAVPIVLQGVPASVVFVPSESSSLDADAGGFILPKCVGAAQKVSVFGVDADGNLIAGPGAPQVALTSDDPAQLGVSAAGANGFALVRPASPQYPHGNHTIHFTARATPGASSGATARSATIGVTYSGDICGVFTGFPIPTATGHPEGIAAGSDGNLWFTEILANKVGRITTTGSITEFPIAMADSVPRDIVSGPGGMWFAQPGINYIARITTSGVISEFYVYTGSAASNLTGGIALGPDGNLWFTKFSAVSTMIGGVVTDYPATTGSAPETIVVGPDKNLWFNEFNPPRQVAKVTTGGAVTEYPIPAGGAPVGIASGPDGAIWFSDYNADISRVTTSAVFTSLYPVSSAGGVDRAIITGPDGALWFADSPAIGRITTAGIVTYYAFPPGIGAAFRLAVGPDGAIWFTDCVAGKIDRLY